MTPKDYSLVWNTCDESLRAGDTKELTAEQAFNWSPAIMEAA